MFQLRPFQKAALHELHDPLTPEKHVLCIAPTGSGKSLIYEEAAGMPERRTLLITPLVALARQQFQKLQSLGIKVCLGAGDLSEGPPTGKSGAWIISPEILSYPSRQAALLKWKPNLLVVDECHCLWEWGENFRTAFTLIPDLLKTYSISKSLWLTATLPYEARLALRKLLPVPPVEMGGFDLPPSLQLSIHQTPWKKRAETLLGWINQQRGPGIVFVPTRETTFRVSRLIAATGKKVIAYHGGMAAEERKNSEVLISQQIPEVIVATSAFGMGMDYPHLSYVALWQAPTSLLSLVQTIGRVGRNPNQQAQALALWDFDDFKLLEWTLQNSVRRKDEFKSLLTFLKTQECRLAGLKRYFDRNADPTPTPCNRCDYCRMELEWKAWGKTSPLQLNSAKTDEMPDPLLF